MTRLVVHAWLPFFAVYLLLSPSASAQDFSRTEIMEIARDLRYTDGPAWSPSGFLLFADVPNNRLFKHIPSGPTNLLRDNTAAASGLAVDKSGRVFVAESAARRIVKIENDKEQVLVKDFEGKAFNSPNDLVLRRNGDLLFTDPAFGSATQQRELDFHGVFRLSAKGEVTAIKRSQTRLNGIALSPDDNTLYLTDTDRRLLLAIDINNRGEARNERELARMEDGIPTGVCVDTKGNIYVAANRILIYDKAGKPLGSYSTPGKPTNCTFGETDGMALFVTTGTGVYRIQSAVPGLLPR
ncbi:MAG: SMP-30/gluconolactonase/LRE family protein [Bryobacterales bacterium]|nr:SMP-30/gluconolactonase/LRE family protein [Bryobacterales bacterium]